MAARTSYSPFEAKRPDALSRSSSMHKLSDLGDSILFAHPRTVRGRENPLMNM